VARVQHRYWGASPLRLQNFLPINHLASVGDVSCFALVNGGTIAFMERFDAADAVRQLERERITCWWGIPTTLQLCVEHPTLADIDTSSVQVIAYAGAAASEHLLRRLLVVCDRVSNGYGLTESVGQVTFTEPGNDLDLLMNTVGRPVPDYELRLVGDDGSVAGVGDAGEIQVRGDFVMRGYWRAPEATAEVLLPDGWLRTGDLGQLRQDGNLQLVGRLKEMFKSGGYNVYPREIEDVVETLPSVATAIVVAVADPLYGEVGHAFVMPRAGADLSELALEAHCRERLANYKVPKRFHIEEELPLLPVGKVDRGALRQRAAQLAAQLARTTYQEHLA
jgi:acyl-CoA synthetase (AMP-forming)/AMP-acid ligase II